MRRIILRLIAWCVLTLPIFLVGLELAIYRKNAVGFHWQPAATDQTGDPLPPGALARIGTVRLSHWPGPDSLALSADAKVMASVSVGLAVRVWDTSTGNESYRLPAKGPPHDHSCLALSGDGRVLAYTSGGQTIYVHEVAGNRELRQIEWTKPKPNTNSGAPKLALSHDGTLLAAWCSDAQIRLWQIADGTLLRQWRLADYATALTFSPDGTVLAAAANPQIRRWETATGKELPSLMGHKYHACALAFSPDGNLLASGGHAEVHVWDLDKGREQRRLGPFQRPVFALAFSSDGKNLSAASDDGQCRVWDLNTARETQEFALPKKGADGNVLANPMGHVVLSGQGKILAWTRRWPANTIRLTEVATGKQLLPLGPQPMGMPTFSPGGRTLASLSSDAKLCTWATAKGKLEQTFNNPEDSFVYLAFTPDAKTLIALGERASFVDTHTGKEQRRLALPPIGLGRWALSPDGKLLILAEPWNPRHPPLDGSYKFAFVDLTMGGQLVATHPDGVTAIAFSADGKTLAMGGNSSSIATWDVAGRKQLCRWAGPPFSVNGLAFSADGRTLVSVHDFIATGKPGLRMVKWETATGKETARHEFPCTNARRFVDFLAFSAGAKLAAFAVDDVIQIWDMTAEQTIQQFRGHEGRVFHAQFSPNGRQLATSSDDGTILIWDVATAGQ